MARSSAEPDRNDAPEDSQRTDFVQSLERGLSVILAFDQDNPSLSLSEVAKATGLTRAAARRFLHTLVDLGYVRTDGRLFSLSPKVLELGYAYLSSLTLPEIAQPHLQKLCEQVHESCSVSVLDVPNIVYVARASAKQIVSISITVGTRYPAHATSMGRVLLADKSDAWLDDYFAAPPLESVTDLTITEPAQLRQVLKDVRAQGYAMVEQELDVAVKSIAVPIRNPAGEAVAAMNIATHAPSSSGQRLKSELLPELKATAALIESELADVGMNSPNVGAL